MNHLATRETSDVLCFGRGGVGKTALLQAITGLQLEASPQLDPVTSKIACHPYKQSTDTDVRTILFWDTPGLRTEYNVGFAHMQADLTRNAMGHPSCVLYCTSRGGRMATRKLKKWLSGFHDKGCAVFWVVTNLYAHSEEEFHSQWEAGKEILEAISGAQARALPWEDAFACGERCFGVAVNSVEYESRAVGFRMGTKNVDALIELITARTQSAML